VDLDLHVTDENQNSAEKTYAIRAVDRTCDILDTLGAANAPVTLTDLAVACNLPKASLFRYLSTLEARKYVEKVEPAGDYRLGIALSNLQVDHFERLARLARPSLEELRDEFGETSNLGLLTGHEISYLEIVESPHSVRLAARKRDRDAIHCTALGKAVAAELPAGVVSELIGVRYSPRTEHTITRWADLKADLQKVREQGYALDDEENEVGGRCVAVRIPGPLGAAISVSAIVARMPMERVPQVAERLKAVAARIGASF
jgi:IclR family acetate operon transcriptional repressor